MAKHKRAKKAVGCKVKIVKSKRGLRVATKGCSAHSRKKLRLAMDRFSQIAYDLATYAPFDPSGTYPRTRRGPSSKRFKLIEMD